MRVLRIATVPFFVLHHLRTQIEQTIAAGYEVIVAVSPDRGITELERIPGVRVIPMKIARAISPLRDIIALFALYRLMLREKPSIVHSTTPKAGLLGMMAAFAARVPVRLHSFTGQAWATHSGMIRWIARLSDRLIVRLSTRCYADSGSQLGFMLAQKVCRDGEVAVLGDGSISGVDLLRYDAARLEPAALLLRQQKAIPTGSKVISFVGRVTRDKGVVELVEAFLRLRDRIPDLFLVVVGPTEPERDPLPAATEQTLKDHPGILAVGYDPSPEVWLRLSHVLCLPSYREGFGSVVIEAAALGVPAVGTRIPGLVDAVVEDVTGLLVPVGDVDALVAALERLLCDGSLHARLAQAAQRRAIERFSAQRVNQHVLDEYARLTMSRP